LNVIFELDRSFHGRKSLPSSRVEERPKPETCITSFDRLQRQRFEPYLRLAPETRAALKKRIEAYRR
jgi:hypothetical protein